jgi:cysteine desulfurase/selenocysteine lyase
MAKVMEHETELTKYALAKLAVYVDQGWLKLYGPNDTKDRLGVISFTIKGVHAHDAAQVLDNFGIAARSGQHCAAPLVNRFGEQALVRVSFYLYNTKAEVDYLVETLPKVADYFLK